MGDTKSQRRGGPPVVVGVCLLHWLGVGEGFLIGELSDCWSGRWGTGQRTKLSNELSREESREKAS